MAAIEEINPSYPTSMAAQLAQGSGMADASHMANAGNNTDPSAIGGHMTSTGAGMAMMRELQESGFMHALDILS